MKHLPLTALAILALSVVLSPTAAQETFLGRWNLTGIGEDSARVYWLELQQDGGQLTGMFLNRTGSPTPLQRVKIENGELVFQTRAGSGGPAPEFRARLQGDKLIGTVPHGERTISFVGVRPPPWPRVNAGGRHQFGRPVALFDGGSLDAFDVQHSDRPSGWSVEDRTMTNAPRANNLVSKERFKDFRILAEYKVTAGTNSGIYLRGRYELQVLDDYGKPPDKVGHMAIYG